MSKVSNHHQFESLGDFYCSAYPSAIVSRSSLGPFDFVETFQQKGDWSDGSNPDLVLTAVLGGQGKGLIDVGAGAFRADGHPGELLLTPPGSATTIHIECDHRIVMMGINYAHLRDSCPDAPLPPDGDFGPLHATMHRNAPLRALLTGLWHKSFTQSQWSPLEAEAALYTYAWSLAFCRSSTAPGRVRGGLAPWQVKKVCDALADEPHYSLSDLASLVAMSPWHFCRAFQVATGTSPLRYQRAMIMERARHALEHSDHSITEIAFDLGYSSSQAFARAFRRCTGFAPQDYRRQRQGA